MFIIIYRVSEKFLPLRIILLQVLTLPSDSFIPDVRFTRVCFFACQCYSRNSQKEFEKNKKKHKQSKRNTLFTLGRASKKTFSCFFQIQSTVDCCGNIDMKRMRRNILWNDDQWNQNDAVMFGFWRYFVLSVLSCLVIAHLRTSSAVFRVSVSIAGLW